MPESSAKRVSFDSAREHLGKIYAKGLLGAAESQHQTEQVLAELDSLIDDVFDKLDQFEQLLASPRISVDEKNRVLDTAFSSRMTRVDVEFFEGDRPSRADGLSASDSLRRAAALQRDAWPSGGDRGNGRRDQCPGAGADPATSDCRVGPTSGIVLQRES